MAINPRRHQLVCGVNGGIRVYALDEGQLAQIMGCRVQSLSGQIHNHLTGAETKSCVCDSKVNRENRYLPEDQSDTLHTVTFVDLDHDDLDLC